MHRIFCNFSGYFSSNFLVLLFSFLIFGIGISFFHPPFIADDYWMLWLSLSRPDFGWTEPYVFSRMPVGSLLAVAIAKSGVLEIAPRLFLSGMFAVHAFALSLFLKTLTEGAIERTQNSATRFGLTFLIPCILFSFQPNNYEIHLWHLLSLHSIGTLFIALAFRVNRSVVKILLI